MNMEKKKCVICGKSFQPRRANSLTCSAECSRKREIEERRKYYLAHKDVWKAQYAARRGKPITANTKKCAWCGKEFESLDYRLKYCSAACSKAQAAHNYKCRLAKLRAENEVKLVKVCKVCGKEFHSPRGTAKYCSGKCRMKVWKVKERERWRAMPAEVKAHINECKKTYNGRVWGGKENYADCEMMGISRSTLDYVADALFSD